MWPQPGGILQWVEAELGRQLQGRRRLQRLGATSPRHPERIGSPGLRGEGPGTQTQAPDAGTQAPGVDLRASGVCRALGAHPGRRELRDGGNAASAGAHQAPEGRAPEHRAGGRCGQWAACESRHHRRSFRVPSARTQSRGTNRQGHRGTAWSGAPGRKRGPAGWSAASIYLPLGGSISSQFRTEEAEAQSGSSCPAGRGWSWNSAAALPLTTGRRCLRHTGTACRRVC